MVHLYAGWDAIFHGCVLYAKETACFAVTWVCVGGREGRLGELVAPINVDARKWRKINYWSISTNSSGENRPSKDLIRATKRCEF